MYLACKHLMTDILADRVRCNHINIVISRVCLVCDILMEYLPAVIFLSNIYTFLI